MIGALNKNWELVFKDGIEFLEKTFELKDFNESISFVNKIASLSNTQNHHPSIKIDWNKVTIQITTHSADNKVTAKDELLALGIEDIIVG